MKPNRIKLKQLMAQHDLNCIAVSKLLGVKPDTVRVWRCNSGHDVPSNTLELLTLKLEAVK